MTDKSDSAESPTSGTPGPGCSTNSSVRTGNLTGDEWRDLDNVAVAYLISGGWDNGSTDDEIADGCYKMGLAFVRARRRLFDERIPRA